MDAKTLIDAAAKICGGQNALARTLGQDKSNVSAWRNGTSHCPVAHVAAMAKLIGAENVAEIVGQVELARAGNPHIKARRGVRAGAVATLRTWAAIVVAVAAGVFDSAPQQHPQLAGDDDV